MLAAPPHARCPPPNARCPPLLAAPPCLLPPHACCPPMLAALPLQLNLLNCLDNNECTAVTLISTHQKLMR